MASNLNRANINEKQVPPTQRDFAHYLASWRNSGLTDAKSATSSVDRMQELIEGAVKLGSRAPVITTGAQVIELFDAMHAARKEKLGANYKPPSTTAAAKSNGKSSRDKQIEKYMRGFTMATRHPDHALAVFNEARALIEGDKTDVNVHIASKSEMELTGLGGRVFSGILKVISAQNKLDTGKVLSRADMLKVLKPETEEKSANEKAAAALKALKNRIKSMLSEHSFGRDMRSQLTTLVGQIETATSVK